MKKTITPVNGQKIMMTNNKLNVPDNPIIPFIEGDGTGVDIWKTSQKVLDSAIRKAYDGKKKIEWLEVYAGEKANTVYGPNTWLPEETLDKINESREGKDKNLYNTFKNLFNKKKKVFDIQIKNEELMDDKYQYINCKFPRQGNWAPGEWIEMRQKIKNIINEN